MNTQSNNRKKERMPQINILLIEMNTAKDKLETAIEIKLQNKRQLTDLEKQPTQTAKEILAINKNLNDYLTADVDYKNNLEQNSPDLFKTD